MPFDNRIYFPGNPWPEGHAIKEFEWKVRARGRRVWCYIHLRSEDYHSERELDQTNLELPDWEAPIVWGNYHSCIMSSTYWGHSGFDLCGIENFTPEGLDGLSVEIDQNPEDVEDFYELAFGLYLLGHDACGKHKLTFSRIGQTNNFNISWLGKIALTYAGEHEFKYDFQANVADTTFPVLMSESD